MHDDRLVNLEIFEYSRDALVLRSKLEAYGIFVHTVIPLAGNVPYRPVQEGGIPVMVRARDYETAKAIMDDVEGAVRRRQAPSGDRPTMIVLAVTLGMLGWYVYHGIGTVESLGFGGYPMLYWFIVLLWAIAAGEAIRLRRRWWLLCSAPIVLYPALATAAMFIG